MKVELSITPRQNEILQLLLEGWSCTLIAYKFKCSVSNISQVKALLLERYPKLKRLIRRASKKYKRVQIEIPDELNPSPNIIK